MPPPHARTVIALRHVACEGLGAIAPALAARGVEIREICTHRGDAVPADLGGARGLVVMGGPMGVYEHDAHPFLSDERALVERALRDEVPILGVCLGSQLLAQALGARVAPSGGKEIGWLPVTLRDDANDDALFAGVASPLTALHWHGDVFDLPRGATSLARSEMTEHQAFRYGARAWGLLFHLEADAAQVRAMSAAFARELEGAHVDATELDRASQMYDKGAEAIARRVFGRWADLVVA